MHLVLYGKPHCSLCDKAREMVEDVIDDLAPTTPGAVPEVTCVDITSNEVLMQRYRHDIPVVALDGEEICRLKVDAALLRDQLLARALAGGDACSGLLGSAVLGTLAPGPSILEAAGAMRAAVRSAGP